MSEPTVVPLVRPRRDRAHDVPPAVPGAVAGAAPQRSPGEGDTAAGGSAADATVDALGLGLLLHDAVGRVTDLDASAAAVLGVAVDDVIGMTWHDPAWGLLREDGRPMAGHEHPVMQVLADGTPRRGAVVGLRVRPRPGDGTPPADPVVPGPRAAESPRGADRDVRWLRLDVALVDAPGGRVQVAALVGDVTTDVDARLTVAVETLRTRRLLAPERDVVLRVSRWGKVLGAGDACEDVLGRTADDVVGCSVVEFVSPADRPAVKARFDSLAHGEGAVLRVRVRRRGGERRWTRLGMRWVDADLSEAHVVLADEHDAVVASAEAEELRAHLTTVSLTAHETIGLHGADGTFTWVSERAAQDLGWEPEDLLGRPLHALVHPDDVARVDGAHGSAAAGDAVAVRYRFRGADDEHRLVETVLSGRLDPATGRVVELRSATRPAEDLVDAERRLDVAEELFRRSVEQSPVGTAVLAPDGSWRQVNDALVRALGQARGVLLRRRHDELLTGTSREDVRAGLVSVAAGERDTWHGAAEYLGGDGDVVPVRLAVSAVRSAEHELVCLLLHVVAGAATEPDGRPLARALGTDELTGLRQPEVAADRLVNALERSTRTGRSVGVLWFALDGLDDLVAAHGRAAGDSVVVEVAGRLRRTLRLGDTLARVGQDAFLAVCEDVHELEISKVAARATATVDVQAPGTGRGRVTASVGAAARACAGSEDPVQVAEELLASADAAARQVRLRGGAGWHHTRHTFV
ncbi:PAS domain S-box protein [Aquipuribacter nitratireducens]|uniref:PAS domain S-box protein n=1 Tax=Aquipuribacter nitratireducens TaxID=650104 RepID=A0ABW0GIT3_9MICO